MPRADARELLKEGSETVDRVRHASKRSVVAFNDRLRSEITEVAFIDRLEGRFLFVEKELDFADRAVAMLLDKDLGDVGLFILGAVTDHVFPVDEHDDIRVLLDGARITQV